MNLAGIFRDAYPKAVDFPEQDYEFAKLSFDSIAADYGYHFVGVRLKRAVFSTKQKGVADG